MRYFNSKDYLLKSVLINDDFIAVADDLFDTPEALQQHIQSGKKGMLSTALQFPYSAIKNINLFESENGIQLIVSMDKGTEKVYLQFSSMSDYNWALEQVQSKSGITAGHHKLSSKKTGGYKVYLYMLIAAALGAALAFIARDIEMGQTTDHFTGRRRGLKILFYKLAEFLGFYGSIAVGIVGVVLTYFLYRRK